MPEFELMPEIQIEITRCVDEASPGFVEFELVDALGERHRFVDKVPVVTEQQLDASCSYPVTEWVQCEVIGEVEGASPGRLRIDTSRPWGLESIEGRSEFEVAAKLVR